MLIKICFSAYSNRSIWCSARRCPWWLNRRRFAIVAQRRWRYQRIGAHFVHVVQRWIWWERRTTCQVQAMGMVYSWEDDTYGTTRLGNFLRISEITVHFINFLSYFHSYISGRDHQRCPQVKMVSSQCRQWRYDLRTTDTFRQQTHAYRVSTSRSTAAAVYYDRSCCLPSRPKISALCDDHVPRFYNALS